MSTLDLLHANYPHDAGCATRNPLKNVPKHWYHAPALCNCSRAEVLAWAERIEQSVELHKRLREKYGIEEEA